MAQTAMKEKVVLAYSGGLDTSVCLKWLQVEKGFDVIAVCGNVGQDENDLAAVKQKAIDMGAVASFAVDMREEYANEYVTLAIAANGLYENSYPLLSALSRPLLSKHMVEVAHAFGAKYVAHGCTGKGNDQVRFETSIKALDPSIEIVAPVREWNLHSREEEMEWAKAMVSPFLPRRSRRIPLTTIFGAAQSNAACSKILGASPLRTSGRLLQTRNPHLTSRNTSR